MSSRSFIQKFITSCEQELSHFISFIENRFVKENDNHRKNNQIISLTDCKRILNGNGNHYSDDDILQIRDFLILLAELQHSHYKSKEDEKSNIVHKSID